MLLKYCLLAVIILSCCAAATNAFDEPTPTPIEPLSFNYCRARLARSDKNHDDFLTVGEYVAFCNQLASAQWTSGHWEHFEEIPKPLQDNYINLIVASAGEVIEIYGVRPNQRDASTIQLEFVEQICSETIEALYEAFTFQGVGVPISRTAEDPAKHDSDENDSGDASTSSDSPSQSPTYNPTQFATQATTQSTSHSSTMAAAQSAAQPTTQPALAPLDSRSFWDRFGKSATIIALLMIIFGAILYNLYRYCYDEDGKEGPKGRHSAESSNGKFEAENPADDTNASEDDATDIENNDKEGDNRRPKNPSNRSQSSDRKPDEPESNDDRNYWNNIVSRSKRFVDENFQMR